MYELVGWSVQAKNPKDQYLLLKALNEVIVSISSGCSGKQLSLAHQQEVCSVLSFQAQAHVAGLCLSARKATLLPSCSSTVHPYPLLRRAMTLMLSSCCLHRCCLCCWPAVRERRSAAMW